MKKRTNRVLTSVIISLMLLVSMTFGAVAGLMSGNGVSGGQLVKTSLDTDELRRQYMSAAVAEYMRYSYSGDRWVIVELPGETLYDLYEKSDGYNSFSDFCASEQGKTHREELAAAQKRFLSKLDADGIDYTVKYSYTTLISGVALRVSGTDCRKISKMDGVGGVYFAESYAVPKVAVSNNANVYSTGIYNTTGISYSGEGMVVAILDTGLDYTHEAFSTMPTSDKVWTKDYISSIVASGRLNAAASADDLYYNKKVPYAYDYADNDADVFPQYSSHGTHVAGIVAGKSSYVVNRENGKEETFTGVAPEAQLVIGKVFTDNLDSEGLGGANSIDILAAVSDCVELGVDVINMSLGSSAGFSDEKSDTFTNSVYNRVREAGISLVVAASNDYSSGFGGGNGTNLATNPDSGTVGAPSTYDAALSVASINGQMSSYVFANGDPDQIAFINESSDGNGNRNNFVEQLYKLTGKKTGEAMNFKYVVVPGVGRQSNYTNTVRRELADKAGYDGTIALVQRGDISFADKIQFAMDNGADACIIYNNLSGTITMSLGDLDDPIPACSIQMDAGKILVSNAKRSVGTVTVSSALKAGPFMSDFSSWGPTPDLRLRPEITAHGGEITSAVAGGYDIYSGTSMAAPNMAGAIALLRQHLKNTTSLTGKELNALVNQVLMSTATIALNENGNPYSPRKQGAGLAGIKNAIESEGYITVKDAGGNVLDKTKVELLDDKKRTGVYEFTFTVHNIKDTDATYTPATYVMTETLASDNKTVAERSYMLSDSRIVYTVNGKTHTGSITVPANGEVTVSVRITLSDAAKKYIDKSFKNGMYVEGFVSLRAEGNTKVTLGLPYLAFYGDWNDAPLFDYSEYELAESQKDTSVDPEDKLVTSAASTRVMGRYYDGKYVIPMGTYIYTLDDSDVQIYPEKEKIAVSRFDTDGQHTIYEVYMVYAGLLRGAAYMDIEVKDAVTGDVIFSERQENIRKAYAAGGAGTPSAVNLEINPATWNLVNNGRYTVTMKGQLDYPGGENPNRGEFDFEFTVDYEAPQVTDYRIRYEAYTENKQTKYRIYMDVDVFDNQYVQDVMPCYIRDNEDGTRSLTLVSELPIPVYGGRGEKSTVTFEITDIYEDYVKTGKLYLAVEDYAMNQMTYVVTASEGIGETGKITLNTDTFLTDTGNVGFNASGDKTSYGIYDLTLAPGQLYVPSVNAPDNLGAARNLTWTVSTGSGYLRTYGTEIYTEPGTSGKTATLRLVYGEGDDTTVFAEVNLRISGDDITPGEPENVVISPVTDGEYRVVDINTTLAVTLNPNMTMPLTVRVNPWYRNDVKFIFSSSNDSVISVDESGVVTAHKKGAAYITVKVEGYPRLEKSVRVTVNGEFKVQNYVLYNYYGGEECIIPDDLNITMIDEDCFKNNTRVKRVVLPKSLTQIPTGAFTGCTSLEYIEINSQCTTVGNYAFDGCAKLTTIRFLPFADRNGVVSEEFEGTITIGRAAFRKCTSLTTIINEKRMTAIHESAFEGCTSLSSIDLSSLRFGGKNAFAKCTSLSEVTTSAATDIGEGMFSGCTALTSFELKGDILPANTFNGCRNLRSVTFTSGEFRGIGELALANTGITGITLPAGEYTIGKGAFSSDSRLARVTLSAGTVISGLSETPFAYCTSFTEFELDGNVNYTVHDGMLISADGRTLVAVPYGKTGITASSLPESVVALSSGVFSGMKGVTSWDLTGYTSVGAYAFAGSGVTSVNLGGLTDIPDGLFSGCRSLTTLTGAENVRTVGASAFASCLALKSLDLPAAETAGEGAFRSSALTSVSLPELRTVGDSAFRATKLTSLSLPKLSVIGSSAFYGMPSVTDITVGGVTSMGTTVFVASPKLRTVTFGEGTTLVGSCAFFDPNATTAASSSLESVTLPASVKTIGAYAFANTKITSIEIPGVTTIGEYAFAQCSSLTDIDLSSVVNIGGYAFYGTKLTSADLALAGTVGDYAFYGTPLTSVTFGALKSVGEYAFSATKLTEVTLPGTFRNAYYDYTWSIFDEKGNRTGEKTRQLRSYGDGAFSAISTLRRINVAASDGDFLSLDGVLYMQSEDGLVLLQYPIAREAKSYRVADGTVMIGASAFDCPEKFSGENTLTEIEFPYTLRRIGEYAFYNSTVKHYTFTSVTAPVLLSRYVSTSQYSSGTILGAIFGDSSDGNALESTIYYANFFDYAAKRIYKDLFNPDYFDSKDFGLTMTIPKNGTGYDTVIWEAFFGTVEKTESALPDDTTHAAMDAIARLGEIPLDSIASAGSLAELDAVSALSLAARRAYNKVSLSEQIALCEEQYKLLLNYELAIRNAKERLGAPVTIDKLEISKTPDRIRYKAGESFDPTGMVVKVIYSDSSELTLGSGDYTTDKTVLSANDDYVTVSYTDRGKTYSARVLLNVESTGDSRETLAAPAVRITDDGYAEWDAVPGATGYIYRIDDGDETTTTERRVRLAAGQSITVKAVGDGYADSGFSSSVTYEQSGGLPVAVIVIISVAAALLVSGGAVLAVILIKKKKGR